MSTPTGRTPTPSPAPQAVIAWTRPMLERFKKAHTRAKDAGLPQFVFDQHEFDTGYAGYLIQYLESQLPPYEGFAPRP